MTLEPYDSDRLDQLAMRVFDLAARLRAMAVLSRHEELPPQPLHDRKPLEWLEKLEDWLLRNEAELSHAVIKNQGARRAREARSARVT
jgi:hypothetical protein